MPHAETPVRSLQQRLDALDRANDVRGFRKDLKRDIEAGRVTFCQIVSAVPDRAETMTVIDLIVHVPRVGRVKALKVLHQAGVPPSKTLGGLSQRQRIELVREMKGR